MCGRGIFSAYHHGPVPELQVVGHSACRCDTILFKTVSRFSRRGQVDACILEHLWSKGIYTEFADPGLVWPRDREEVLDGLNIARISSELKAAELAAAHTFLDKTGGTVHGAIAKLQGAGVCVFPHAHPSTTIPAPTFGDAEAVDWSEHPAFSGGDVPDLEAPLLPGGAIAGADYDGDDVFGMPALDAIV